MIPDNGFFKQGARGAGLHAFTAAYTCAVSHGVIEIEDDLGMNATTGHTDYIIYLDISAGSKAKVTVDACVKIDGHGRMGKVILRHFARNKPAV